jgi:hypothetical protein
MRPLRNERIMLMTNCANSAPPDPATPAHQHFEVVWRTTPGKPLVKTGQLVRDIVTVVLGLQSGQGVQPTGIEVRRLGGPVIARFTYSQDGETARRETALIERQLARCTVDEFLAFLWQRRTAPSPQRETGAHNRAEPEPSS